MWITLQITPLCIYRVTLMSVRRDIILIIKLYYTPSVHVPRQACMEGAG